MCGIFCTFNSIKLKELYNLNKDRGNISQSIIEFNSENMIDSIKKSHDNIIESHIIKNSNYAICHIQAPTNGLFTNFSRIHPACRDNKLLWHNGIIKDSSLKQLSKIFNISNIDWDTQFILDLIYENTLEKTLSILDGSFACIYYNGVELFLFRNEIAPLFIDNELNISSTPFENSNEIDPNAIYKLNLKNKSIEIVNKFEANYQQPYFFFEE
jgi:predicted glutamine amidotransferase